MAFRLAGYALRAPARGVRCARVLQAYRRAQEQLRHVAGTSPGDQTAWAAAHAGCSTGEVEALVGRWMEREPLELLPRFARPGLRSFLVRARDAGIQLAVLSDYPAGAKLEALGLADLFEVVLCAQDSAIGAFKPDPAGLREAVRCLRTSSAECLYVGDRPEVDAVAADRADMPCAIFARRAPPGALWTGVPDVARLDQLVFGSPA
jgi:beta-phosphoglucomutase-like phosphatase (HAD superfamily)